MKSMHIPGYKIIDTLGEGGMATVYLAIQESFEREVALKVLDPRVFRDPSFGERFLREARIVSRLMHPNIVTVYDVGVHRGLYFLSMEYVPGRDLKHRRFELSLYESLQAVKDVAGALDYAARKGCVHRDVKPDNIMLHAEDGRAVLMDFGIARIADFVSSMTQAGTTVGTPHYMSPEQARGGAVDARSDLYSLGVVLFLLLTGRLPYDSDSAVSVGVMHISESIPRLPAHLAPFQRLVDRAMAKDPDDRFQSGAEFSAALDAFSDQQLAEIEQEGDRSLMDEISGDTPTLYQQPEPWSALADDLDSGIPHGAGPLGDIKPESLFAHGEDDRIDTTSVPARSRRGRWVWGLLLLAGIGGAAYYYQVPLLQPWQTALSPSTEQSPPSFSAGTDSDFGVNEAVEASADAPTGEAAEAEPPETPLTFDITRVEPLPLEEERALTKGGLPESEARSEQERLAGAGASAASEPESEPEPAVSAQEPQQADELPALQQLQARVERLLDQGDWEAAAELLQPGREQFPGSPELLALAARLSELEEAAQRPAIEQLRVSKEPLVSLDANQVDTLKAGRVLYVGFAFQNFAETSAVIQAILYDGFRRVQIAQVPVIVRGLAGESFFRIERPVTGFSEGSYTLDLMVEGERLASTSFQIEN